MVLQKVHPEVDLEEVRSDVGWPLKVVDSCGTTELPTPEELRVLREELDPDRIYLK
jgi:glutaconate CoA-transferase subunit B